MTTPLVAAWWTQAIVLSAVLAAAAMVLQRLAKDAVPVRLVWAGALVVSTVLVGVAPLRVSDALAEPAAIVPRSATAGVPAVSAATTAWRAPSMMMDAVGAALERPARVVAAAVAPLGARAGRLALAAWGLGTAACLVLLAVGHHRLRRLVRAAEVREVDGVPVRLTAAIGPAVVGLRDPLIVAPRWLLDRPAHEQALIVRHERSHVMAGDPALLMGGVLLAALQPWNPVAWLMVRRLRLAIELDCDRRLLRGGTAPRAYGDLLISLAGAATPRLVAPAIHPMFTHHRSHLARRILAMTDRPVRHRLPRRALVAVLALAAVAAACESRLPTTAEVEQLDAAMVERRVAGRLAANASEATWFVDGKEVTAAEAKAIPAGRIVSVEVEKRERPRIMITTGTPPTTTEALAASGRPDAVVRRDPEGSVRAVFRAPGDPARTTSGAGDTITLKCGDRCEAESGAAQPLLIVDGVRMDASKLSSIPGDRIVSAEVIKGEAARKRFGADGANGVIIVITRR